MPKIKLTIEYEGTRYNGWQLQKNGKTIQGELENAFKVLFKKRIVLTASGRTDAGVHARNQIVHCNIPVYDLKKLQNSLNGLVEKDIAVKEIRECNADFHARFDAKSRCYQYFISKKPTAINRNYSWYISYPLNITAMQNAALEFKNVNYYKAFCKTNSSNKTYDCSVYESEYYFSAGFLVYRIVANRFLYGMVRAISGTLVKLGQGELSYNQFTEIIESGNRSCVPFTAPAAGLFLEKITY